MNRRGSALLLVLWLVVLLSGVAMVSLGGARTGSVAARNRLTLLRAAWAGEACLEILRGRALGRTDWAPETLLLDSVDLGEGVWCRATVDDPGERVNLNLATREMLLALVSDTALIDTLIARRPWPAPEAILGLPSLKGRAEPEWLTLLTTRGMGKVNLNRAPIQVLRTLPGLGYGGARVTLAVHGPKDASSIEEWVQALPSSVRDNVLAQYQAFASLSTVRPEQLVVTLSGHLRDGPLLSTSTVTLVPAGNRLAVIRRETQ